MKEEHIMEAAPNHHVLAKIPHVYLIEDAINSWLNPNTGLSH